MLNSRYRPVTYCVCACVSLTTSYSLPLHFPICFHSTGCTDKLAKCTKWVRYLRCDSLRESHILWSAETCNLKWLKVLTKSDFSKPQVTNGAGWSWKSKNPRTSSCAWAVTRQIGSSYEYRARTQGGLYSKRSGRCNVSWEKVFIALLSSHTKQFSKRNTQKNKSLQAC